MALLIQYMIVTQNVLSLAKWEHLTKSDYRISIFHWYSVSTQNSSLDVKKTAVTLKILKKK